MQPLKDTATRVLQDLLRGQPATPAKIEFAWRIAAGPALARATDVAWRDDGVLAVRAKTGAWQREVARARPIVLARLTSLLGPGVVRRISLIEDSSCEKQ